MKNKFYCFECGKPYSIDENGVSRHTTADDKVDHDADSDHAAYGEEPFDSAPKLMGDVEYRLQGGNKCPVCGEMGIEREFVEVDGAYAHQQCACDVCGHTWINHYKLQGFSHLETIEGDPVDRGHCPYCKTDEDLDLMFEAAANGYANDKQDDHIGRILAGEEVGDTLAEFIVAEIRDITVSHDPDAEDYNRLEKFGEVAAAFDGAVEKLRRVESALNRLYYRIEEEESSTE